jgi:hypothetical protein
MITVQVVLQTVEYFLNIGVAADDHRFAKPNAVRVRLADDEVDQPSLGDQRRERDRDEAREKRERQLDTRRQNGDDREHHGRESHAEQESATVAPCVARSIRGIRIEANEYETNERRPESSRVCRRGDFGGKQCRADDCDRVENMERSNAQHLTPDGDEESALGELAPQANVVGWKRKYPSRVGYAPRQLDVCVLDN